MKVTIPNELHEKVKFYAATASLTQGQVIEMILDDYFNEKKIAATLKKIMEIENEAMEG